MHVRLAVACAALLLLVAGCDVDRSTEVLGGDEVRLSDTWVMTVPDGWEGDIIRHGRTTFEKMGGVHSDISLTEVMGGHATIVSIQIIREELARSRIEFSRGRGARLVHDDALRTAVVVESEERWVWEEVRSGPSGEHVWIKILRGDRGPWEPDPGGLDPGEYVVQMVDLRSE